LLYKSGLKLSSQQVSNISSEAVSSIKVKLMQQMPHANALAAEN